MNNYCGIAMFKFLVMSAALLLSNSALTADVGSLNNRGNFPAEYYCWNEKEVSDADIPLFMIYPLPNCRDPYDDSVVYRFHLLLFHPRECKLTPLHDRIIKEYILGMEFHGGTMRVWGRGNWEGRDSVMDVRTAECRAEYAMKYLRRVVDIDSANISHAGFGKERLLCNDELPEGRFFNRTVEIVVKVPRKPDEYGRW